MSATAKGREMMEKATRAIRSAKLLLAAGDADGACNRAYYAMFDAARAVLMVRDAPEQAQTARTHGGLVSAFGRHLVQSGQVSAELGRILNKAQESRLIADYSGDILEGDDAARVVEDAQRFVSVMRDLIEERGE
uniref:Uncharacterized protein, contains HEPN domain, UPF0332 family n=1 Tax=Candidatus Kentrum sp. FM TaxID=2126340 RepID=A0A450S054_9GAMM|nr:MAG: Uncharacterized protein, contains HEPN domain, UPF0332 family [Candidatus Kentron sp. FM]VFJ45511.1 MAG: Uncharacterized protein, contains HEPN domain, UPF0332 family [Candidatus Kentron sp. FM]VFK06729.1 MAG: Uncharacterized protein, contains HEPN domain, UPF0332 family [Candidatus Kentron sp. FM]